MHIHRFLGIIAILAAMGCLTLVSYFGVGSAGVRAAPAFTACAVTGTAALVTSGTTVATGTALPACTPEASTATAVSTSGGSVATVTVVPATAVATSTTLRASPILAQHVVFARAGHLLTFRWRMVTQDGIKGYRLFAQHHALTGVIKPHHAAAYRVRVRFNGRGPFFLKVLTRYGMSLRIHANH